MGMDCSCLEKRITMVEVTAEGSKTYEKDSKSFEQPDAPFAYESMLSAADAGRDTPKVEVASMEDLSNHGGTGHSLTDN